MATMIPPEISAASKAPHGEREIFQSLRRDCGASATWVVMHSLDIRWHICKLEGEADFLVLAPGLGVLVVEVKGCNVTRRNGMWTYHYESPKTKALRAYLLGLGAQVEVLGPEELRQWMGDEVTRIGANYTVSSVDSGSGSSA